MDLHINYLRDILLSLFKFVLFYHFIFFNITKVSHRNNKMQLTVFVMELEYFNLNEELIFGNIVQENYCYRIVQK